MPHSRFRRRSLAPFSLLAPLALVATAGCISGSGKRDYGELLTIDKALVQDRIERLEAAVPACTATTAAARRTNRLPVAGTGSTGSCGGAVAVDTAHDNGITDYTLDLDAYCMSGTDAGDVVVDGVVVGQERGTPSDAGPIIDSFSLETDGPLTVDHDGPDLEITIDGVVADYGLPAAWTPDTATAADPDVTTLDLLTVHFPGGEESDLLVGDLVVERVGTPPQWTITEGALALEGEGYVQISTPPGEPFAFGGVDTMSGSIVLTGADDTQLIITTSATTPMAVELELNGAPMAQGVDCSPALPFLVQGVAAAYLALPLY